MPYKLYQAGLVIPDGFIFAFFVLSSAGLTSASIVHMNTSRRQSRLALTLTFVGLLASGILGFNTEELTLVCLPLIIGCLMLCSSVLEGKKAESRDQNEKAQLSEV